MTQGAASLAGRAPPLTPVGITGIGFLGSAELENELTGEELDQELAGAGGAGVGGAAGEGDSESWGGGGAGEGLTIVRCGPVARESVCFRYSACRSGKPGILGTAPSRSLVASSSCTIAENSSLMPSPDLAEHS